MPPTSFEGLRAEGIGLVQVLSGLTWTDFNLHDPGVTILEQLCYALTDLLYRADFPVADHLTGDDGDIHYAAQALPGPAEVFPCRPTTIADYRCALLDTIETIDNAWLSSAPESAKDLGGTSYQGLYRIVVKYSGYGADAPNDEAAKNKSTLDLVRAVYRNNRNLCEDVGEVTSIAQVEYDLFARIEIGGSRSPSDIVADIYDRCARTIAPGVVFHPFELALEQGQTLDEILNRVFNPVLDLSQKSHKSHGVLLDDDLSEADRRDRSPLVGDLLAQVRAIDGIRSIEHLALRKVREASTANGAREAPRLRVPPEPAFSLDNIQLFRGGSEVPVSEAEVRFRYLDLCTREHARRHGQQSIEALRPLPRGVRRDLQRYTSIQNDFPAIYGINAYGLPASASAERKAQALQLKAFLVLFEQIIANGAAQLHHLRDLYSVGKSQRKTYWEQALDETAVAGIREPDGVAPATLPTSALTPLGHDQDRRNRVLDYLLALHGETFAQNSLRQWDRYHDSAAREETLLANKRDYLRKILRIGRDRASAFDYSKPSWHVPGNCSGFQTRVSLLLGFKYLYSRALATGSDKNHGNGAESEGMHVVEHILLRPAGERATPEVTDDTPASFYSLRMTVIFPAWTARGRKEGFQRFAQETVQLNCPAHVYAQCLWLEFPDMQTFEGQYARWLDEKVAACKPNAGLSKLDAAARAVVKFLLSKGVTPEMDGPADG